MKLLLAAKEQSDAAGWRSFQGACQTLKLQRTRALGEARELEAAIDAAARAARLQAAEAALGRRLRTLPAHSLPVESSPKHCDDPNAIPYPDPV